MRGEEKVSLASDSTRSRIFLCVLCASAVQTLEQPVYGGIGGCGGYALIYDSKTKQVRALDFIGTAPAAATLEMYTKGTRLWDRAHLARDSFIAPTVLFITLIRNPPR